MTIESAMIKAIRKFNVSKLGSIREIFPAEWTGNGRKITMIVFSINYVENNEPDCPYKTTYIEIKKLT